MTSTKQRTFLGHPLGLYVLFVTEMWERFSYYGMRALLILYMINYFKWTQQDASQIYKVYTSFVYITPILGGFLADRYLGNKWAVIIGAVLMAIGHFLMAFEQTPIFYAALIFLIFGNGFFKPNMTTQVGRLYPPNDGRRDGAYTIFYMGINLGAFLAPLACGWLAENTVGGYHTGFAVAGIGMVLGLIVYVLGQPLILEIASTTPAEQSTTNVEGEPARKAPLTESEAERTPSIAPGLAALSPALILALGGLALVFAPICLFVYKWSPFDAVMLGLLGGSLLLFSRVCSQVQNGVRDRVLVILIVGAFVVFFWGAFEQAGNVLNVWADKNTNRYLTKSPPEISLAISEQAPAEEAKAKDDENSADKGSAAGFWEMFRLKKSGATQSDEETNWINPVPTAWFQTINALGIFLIAPLFAMMWLRLDRANLQPSIPAKMVLGLMMVAASMLVMIGAAYFENQPSTALAPASSLPGELVTDANGRVGHTNAQGHFEVFHAGRLKFDGQTKTFAMTGVLADTDRDRILAQSAPKEFQKAVKLARTQADEATGKMFEPIIVPMEKPAGFAPGYAGLRKSTAEYSDEKKGLVVKKKLADKDVQAILVAGADPAFRAVLHKLYVDSQKFQVSPWWLFWSYILATLGELSLSPVGLSMVSKLAPARFATMLMGVWLLTSALGNFAAGASGEIWGLVTPIDFFTLLTGVCVAAGFVLLLLVKPLTKGMHGVN